MKKHHFFLVFLAFLTLQTLNSTSLAQFRNIDYQKCHLKRESVTIALNNVRKGNKNAVKHLAGCLKHSHKLIFHACLIDPSQLQHADDKFKDNELFVTRLMKIHPEILQYASTRLRNDHNFIKRASYINRDAFKYASKKLRNNKYFVKQMIKRDSKNYIYASKRVQSFSDIAALALSDDGSLLAYAPEKIRNNPKLVKIAIKSDATAYNFISPTLKKAKKFKKPTKNQNFQEKFTKIFKKDQFSSKNLDHGKSKTLIKRNYITKWHRKHHFYGHLLQEDWHLINAPNRNYLNLWQEDLKKYPKLVKKIEKFFKKRYIDRDTIDSLHLINATQAQEKPLTLAINFYLLTDSNDFELRNQYVNITSLTAIAHQIKGKWHLSVINTDLGSEKKTDLLYLHGHKRYFLHNIYFDSKKSQHPKFIYRVEGRLKSYYEIFSQNNSGKYKLQYRFKAKANNSYK